MRASGMTHRKRPLACAAAAILLAGGGAVATAGPGDATSPPDVEKSDLRAALDSVVGVPVHGDLTVRYRARWNTDVTDQDLYQFLNLRAGDESKDRVSGAVFVRFAEDLDSAHSRDGGSSFRSLDDTFGRGFNALLYTAYATIRPAGGPFESLRVGRQYVYAAETFHLDGVSVTTRPLIDAIDLKLTVYGGIPVHFYEGSSGGDWLLGLRLAADPWAGTRAALDYTHDEDSLSILGTKPKNDFAAFSVWQEVAKNADLYGQFSWLDGPRDATLRGTVSFPESDLTIQASYYHLFETQRELATEFDPYTSVLQELVSYHQADLRVSKGFGEHFDVEVGASARELLDGEAESPFNRDTRRVYVTPTVTDLPWQGTSVSVTGESYSGNGEDIRTWGVDVSHRFSKTLKVSVGSDYSLYAYGPLATVERSNIRTVYARAKFPLTSALSADIRYTWERDDVETFHGLTLALVLDF